MISFGRLITGRVNLKMMINGDMIYRRPYTMKNFYLSLILFLFMCV